MPRGVESSASFNNVPPPRAPTSNLTARVVTAAIGIPLVLLVTYRGGWVFGIVVGLVAIASELELLRMFRAGNHRPLPLLALPAAGILAAIPAFSRQPFALWDGAIVVLLLLAGIYALRPGTRPTDLTNWTLSIAGPIYIGLLLGHLTLLREVHHGVRWVALLFLMTWAYDTGAFAAGRAYGHRPFMAHISPSKTVEGVLGGLLLSTIAGLVGVGMLSLAVGPALILGFATGLIVQLGDLIESMIKRQMGVKDSGSMLPGHGGLLDRIDGLLFAAALGYYAAAWLGYAA